MYQFQTRLEQQVTAKVVGQLSNLLYSLLPKTCSRGHMSCLMDHEKFSFTKPRMRKKKEKTQHGHACAETGNTNPIKGS